MGFLVFVAIHPPSLPFLYVGITTCRNIDLSEYRPVCQLSICRNNALSKKPPGPKKFKMLLLTHASPMLAYISNLCELISRGIHSASFKLLVCHWPRIFVVWCFCVWVTKVIIPIKKRDCEEFTG